VERDRKELVPGPGAGGLIKGGQSRDETQVACWFRPVLQAIPSPACDAAP
jgi:hypothetical protein